MVETAMGISSKLVTIYYSHDCYFQAAFNKGVAFCIKVSRKYGYPDNILDSIFVTGMAGLRYRLATLLLIAPAIVLAKNCT